MNSSQIEKNVRAISDNFNSESFIYDLLLAYGISKTSITRLKSGDFNLSKEEGEVLYKKKVLFKVVAGDKLLVTIDELTKDEDSLKHNPRFVIVTDYKTLLAKDVRTGQTLDTPILEIHKHYDFFLPWAGQEKYQHKNENHADRKAAEEMAKLYEFLVHENEGIYDDGGHNLNIFLSRLLFCFFAEDTNIFPVEGMFTAALTEHTKVDGSDVHEFLNKLFKILNTEDNSDEALFLQKFPYVNGGLFRDTIQAPKFSVKARKILLECGSLNWSEINPDIFGSMIQAVVHEDYRSGLGMHYTSVPNIMKVIEPLFLDELYEEFEKNADNDKGLRRLINRLSKIKIFDPACGSGNFLIIAYKELRKLEIEIWKQIDILKKQSKKSYQTETVYTEIHLSQFYGIELDDFAHEMAILSLWLAEHQMNKLFVDDLYDFGRAKPILPLKEAGHITQGNSLRLDWKVVCPADENDEVYILGNPPYLGSSMQDKMQKEDMSIIFKGFKNYKNLDYIACWFKKGSDYIVDLNSSFSFVSTNSICQGEQVDLLWPYIYKRGLGISFAHTSFKWTNSAKGNAGVIVVIIGIRNNSQKKNIIYSNGLQKEVKNINPYLSEGSNITLPRRSSPISKIPKMVYGNKSTDGGYLFLNTAEKDNLIKTSPESKYYVKKLVGAIELIRGIERWCLWIEDCDVDTARQIPFIDERLKKVTEFRLKSKAQSTVDYAVFPNRFKQRTYNGTNTIIIPRVSSERRDYIPFDFFEADTIVLDSAQAIYNAQPWIFGVISAKMHVIWVKATGGRLKSDFRYSSSLSYNNFPFPTITDNQKETINLHVFNVLGERAKYPEKTLAQLYDPNKMPAGLREAHQQLDLAIERCYRLKAFESDSERLDFLFKEYEKMTTVNKPSKVKIKALNHA